MLILATALKASGTERGGEGGRGGGKGDRYSRGRRPLLKAHGQGDARTQRGMQETPRPDGGPFRCGALSSFILDIHAHRTTFRHRQRRKHNVQNLHAVARSAYSLPGHSPLFLTSRQVYAAGSEDMDTLTFNAPVLYRHLTFSEARKQPISEIHLDKALEGLDMTMSQVHSTPRSSSAPHLNV